MPKVLRFDGLRVVIYPNDHRPAHVHVYGSGVEALFFLNCPNGPPSLRENYGFRSLELNRIMLALTDKLTSLCLDWSTIHDPD